MKYSPELVFDESWDTISGEDAKCMLVSPLLCDGELMGVLQLVNKVNEDFFSAQDEHCIEAISDSLALAINNQQKMSRAKPTKFSHLINNGLLSQQELTKAISKARTSGMDIEAILLHDMKIKRTDYGKSLETFYNIPYYGYSDQIILPQSLFTGLNTNFLLKNNWLPIQKDDDSVTILIR